MLLFESGALCFQPDDRPLAFLSNHLGVWADSFVGDLYIAPSLLEKKSAGYTMGIRYRQNVTLSSSIFYDFCSVHILSQP